MGFRSGKFALQQSFVKPSAATSQASNAVIAVGAGVTDGAGGRSADAAAFGASLNIDQAQYARVIVELNAQRVKSQPFPLVNHFKQAAQEIESYYEVSNSRSFAFSLFFLGMRRLVYLIAVDMCLVFHFAIYMLGVK